MTTKALMLLALAVTVACGVTADGPPEIEVDRTACSHCGMLISEPVYAAAYRAPGSQPRVFDDIGCLLEAARKEPRVDTLRFWFHDAASLHATSPQGGSVLATGHSRVPVWIDGKVAVFVGAPTLRTPMGGGLIAFRDRAAAREGAARHQGSIMDSIDDLFLSHNPGGNRVTGQAR